MRISALLDRPVILLGLGREGLAAASLLRARGHRAPCFALADQLPPDLPTGVRSLGVAELAALQADRPVAVRSPGFAPHHPLRQALQAKNIEQTTGTRIMLAELQHAGIATTAITASKGKSTTSTLLQGCLAASGVTARLLGNIGAPALAALDTVLAERPQVVLELSSYQCDDLQAGEGPSQAVLGPLFPEHLDWHGSLEAYYAAKVRLLQAVPAGGRLVVHASARPVLEAFALDGVLSRPDLQVEWVQAAPGQGLFADAAGIWRDGERIIDSVAIRLPGQHNRENACLAFAAARHAGADVAGLHAMLQGFAGLPYRLQDEGMHGGRRWINDSISTAPEAACAALEACQGQVDTLVVGGQDRGYDYQPLLAAIRRWRVRHVVTLPDSGARVLTAQAMADPGVVNPGVAGSGVSGQALAGQPAAEATATPQFHAAGNLQEAVQLSYRLTPPGGLCLFSPAAPSYHLWSGFEARGAEFRRWLTELPPNPSA